MSKVSAPFGTWPSPIDAALIAANDTRLRNLQVSAGAVYWLEVRPAERGRGVVVGWTAARGAHDVTPASADVGTRVHEYGGGEYRCAADALVYSEKSDGSVWLIAAGAAPRPVAAVAGCRYADFAFDAGRECIYAVREDHRRSTGTDPVNAIVALDVGSAAPEPARNEGRVVFADADFAVSPRLSPDGAQLAWIAWNFPNMPWDQTHVYLADVAALERPRIIAGVPGGPREAVEQLGWSPDGVLYFTSDRSGWANVYAYRDGRTQAVYADARDYSRPPWQLGAAGIAPLADGRLLSICVVDGERDAVALTDGTRTTLPIGQVSDVPQPFGTGIAFIAEPADAPAEVRLARQPDGRNPATLRAAAPRFLAPGDVAVGRPMAFEVGSDERTHAFFYAPASTRYAGPPGSLPPLLVTSHGGPTSMRTNAFQLSLQYWTTRGFAVADVNYRGSTGFGVAYRERLRGCWGVVDVEDCIAVAQGLIAAGLVDPARIAIRGGSSSGFTTLAALAALAASRVFGAGASYYPVTDLRVFTGETHKFESRYIDGLIGPPSDVELYRSRSPVANAGTIVAPVAIFQGLDDKVVPPNQSELMVAALRANGTPVEYHAYAGEGHGFLKAETLAHALEAEHAFYCRVFGITIRAAECG